ncbi:MAG: MFS transporter [Acidimicrobiales bacterium]
MRRRSVLRRKLGVIAPLLVVTMIFRGSQNMAQTTMSILGHERLHLDPATIGAVMAGSALCGVAASALIAPHVPPDRRPLAVAAGLTLLTVALVLFATSGGLDHMAVAAGLLGIGGGLTLPTLMTMAGSWGGPDRDRDLALYTMALSLSLAVGPLVEALVLRVTRQSLTSAFLVFAGFPVVAVVLGTRRVLPAAEVDRGAGSGAAGAGGRGRWRGRYRELLANRAWRSAVTGMLIYQVPFVAIVTFGGSMARVVDGASPAAAEIAFGTFFVMSLAARGWAAWRAPIGHKAGALWVSALVTVAGLLLLSLGHGMVWLVVAMAVLGIPHGLLFPVVLAMMAGGTTPDQLALANATFLALISMVAVVMPTVLGLLISAYGYRVTMLLVLIPVLGFSSLLGLPRREVEVV